MGLFDSDEIGVRLDKRLARTREMLVNEEPFSARIANDFDGTSNVYNIEFYQSLRFYLCELNERLEKLEREHEAP